MDAAGTGADRYDQVPYGGGPAAGAHCRRMEAVATLFGLQATPPARARILDLGCGLGDGLLPQALAYPDARFVGCDAGAAHADHLAQRIATLGLRNIEVWHRDMRDADASWGQFDYIACQGVYSWVPADVRRSILTLLRRNLAPNGVAYLSFNALPGWHLRRVARDLMCLHSAEFADPREAMAQARAMLAAAADWNVAGNAYTAVIREEYYEASHSTDSYLFHEMLAAHNEPFYFRDVIAQIDDAGLRYLGEAQLQQMFAWDLPPAAREWLEAMSLLPRQHYLDLLRGAPFRSSLFCHQAIEPNHRPDPAILAPLFVGLHRHARAEVSGPGDPRVHIGRCSLTAAGGLSAAALRVLHARRPAFVSVHDLLDEAARPAADALLRFLLDAITAGALELAVSPPRLVARAGERPLIGPLARLQARSGEALTNQRHEAVRVSAFQRFAAGLLDGTRDRGGLGEAISRALVAGEVALGPFDPAQDPGNADEVVERVLEWFGRAGLLIA